jgi:hypothetical protein
MLTYDDCLGLGGLTPEEVAVIARHEHLPEIAALEAGSWLRRTLQGKQVIRRMILDGVEEACERGDTERAARLRLVLHHFVEPDAGRPAPAEPVWHADGGEDATGTPHTRRFEDGVEYPMRALGLDTTTALWVRDRVEGHLAAMLRHLGLDGAAVQERFPSEMTSARMRCAACPESRRCRHFLDGRDGGEDPSAFCPNARLFDRMSTARPRPGNAP